MDVPEFPKSTTLILYEQVHEHYNQCDETAEKNVGLVLAGLDYAYNAHNSRDKLPSFAELEDIVSRAYDADNMIREILDEAQGKTRPEGYEYHPDVQVNGYFTLVETLAGYLWGKVVDDYSEFVSTPEKAQVYVEAMRGGGTEFFKLMLTELDGIDEEERQCFQDAKLAILSSTLDLAGKTDAEIIAEAAVQYKDTENGRKSFFVLKSLVDEVVQYHRLP